MADEDDEQTPAEIYASIRDRADNLAMDDDEREDWIEARMRRAGFKKGPGDWISLEDDEDDEKDDDNKPMTRGDYRRIQREQKKRSATPPKRESESAGSSRTGGKKQKCDAWWR
jgi:hypothetical protein